MKRIAIGLVIAIVGMAALGGIVAASVGALPRAQEAEETSVGQGWLGIAVAAVNDRTQAHFCLDAESGAVVLKVGAGSPGADAGLEPGDVIQAVDGEQVENAGQLIDAIQALDPGTVVTLTVLRGDDVLTLEATLGERPVRAAAQHRGQKGSPLPQYLHRLVGAGMAGNVMHAEFEVMGDDGEVTIVAVTRGEVQSTTDGGLVAVVLKDGRVEELQTTEDTRVIVGGHDINLEGLEEGTPVLVVETDGVVTAVVGWPGDMMRRAGHGHGGNSFGGAFRGGAPGALMPGMGGFPGGNLGAFHSRVGVAPGLQLLPRLNEMAGRAGMSLEIRERVQQFDQRMDAVLGDALERSEEVNTQVGTLA